MYLGLFFGAVAVHLPVGTAGARSIRSFVRRTTLMRQRGAMIAAVTNGALFSLTVLFALDALAAPGTGDVDDKLRWMRNIVANGLVRGFQISADDYPPGTYVVLSALTRIAPHLGIGSFLAYKLSIFAFLLLSSLIV